MGETVPERKRKRDRLPAVTGGTVANAIVERERDDEDEDAGFRGDITILGSVDDDDQEEDVKRLKSVRSLASSTRTSSVASLNHELMIEHTSGKQKDAVCASSGFSDFLLANVVQYLDEETILAVSMVCKMHDQFFALEWPHIMQTSQIVKHFMKRRQNMPVQLPPPTFSPRSFLTMLLSDHCANCGAKASTKELNVPLCWHCSFRDAGVFLPQKQIRQYCPRRIGLLAPYYEVDSPTRSGEHRVFANLRWKVDLMWLARDHPDRNRQLGSNSETCAHSIYLLCFS